MSRRPKKESLQAKNAALEKRVAELESQKAALKKDVEFFHRIFHVSRILKASEPEDPMEAVKVLLSYEPEVLDRVASRLEEKEARVRMAGTPGVM